MAHADAKYRVTAEDRTAGAFRSVRGNIDRIVKSIGGLNLATAGAGLALGSMITKTVTTGDELAKAAAKAGVTGEEFQKLAYHASLTGSSQEVVAKALIKVQAAMYDAQRGMKTYKDAFQDLGVDYETREGELRGVYDVFMDLADALALTENKATAVGASTKLLGRGGADLGRFFADGAREIKRSGDELERLGGLMSDDLLVSAEKAMDAWTRFKFSMTGLRNVVMEPLLPILSEAADLAASLVSSLSGRGAAKEQEEVAKWLDDSRTSMREIVADAKRWLEYDQERARLRGAVEAAGPPVDWQARAEEAARMGVHGEVRLPETQEQQALYWYRQYFAGQVALYESLGYERERAILLVRDMIAATGGEMAATQRLADAVGTLTVRREEANKVLEETAGIVEDLAEVIPEWTVPPPPDAWLDAMNEGKALVLAMRSPIEVLVDRQARLNELLSLGAIDLVTYERAMTDAMATYQDTLDRAVEHTYTVMDAIADAGERAAYRLEDAFYDTILRDMDALEALKRFALQVFEDIARAWTQAQLAEPAADFFSSGLRWLGRAFGYGGATGATDFGFAPAPAEGTNVYAAEAPQINIKYEIKALDSRDVTEVLARQAPEIVNLVEAEYNKRGRRSPLTS